MTDKLTDLLSGIEGIVIELGKDLTKYSTLKLIARGDLITVNDLDSLKKVVSTLSKSRIHYNVLGIGANQVLPKKASNPYLQLDFEVDTDILGVYRESYILPASIKLSSLTSHASKFGNKGWEAITGIPATLGGAIFMNAGTGLGWISEITSKVWYVDKEGSEKTHIVKADSFSYRKNNFLNIGDVVYQVELVSRGQDESLSQTIRDYLMRRNASQPLREKTCGSVFKNLTVDGVTCTAGQFVDILNLKGMQIGGMRVSNLHGNFMENFAQSTDEDVISLIKLVQEELYLQYGKKFEPEVRIDRNEFNN